MKVTVDREVCTGCGLCVDSCPEVFELKDDLAIAKMETVPASLENAVKEAAENCPVEAIKIS
ncbi:MAG: ferredoxin [Endomicrobiia bacterium]